MKRWLISVAAICAGSSAFGQTLADHVPADAAIYVGWRGMTNPEPGYTGSHWEKIMQASQFAQFVDDTLPAIGKTVGMKNPDYAAIAGASASVARQVIRHPAAMYVSFPADAYPRAALLCQAGTDADELKKAFDELAAQLPPDVHAQTSVQNDVVSLSIDDAAAPSGDQTLAALPAFKSAVAQVGAEGSVVAYANVDAMRDAGMHAMTKYQAAYVDMANKFLASSGLTGLHAAAFAEQFKDGNWQTESFLGAPSPRKGLVALVDAKPMDQDLFKRVPAHAYLASQLPFDAEQFLTTIRQIAQETYPPAADMLDKGLGIATLSIGKNVETDLLQSLGNQWLLYTAPQIGGTSALGGVLVNKLADSLKGRQSIGALWIFLSNTGQTATHHEPFTLAARTAQIGSVTVNYYALPLFAPSYVVKDGMLYVGLFPQTVAAAADYAGDTLADSAPFKTVAGELQKPDASGVSYSDLPATLGDGYASLLLVSRTFFGLGDMFLAPSPEPIIPPLTVLSKEAAPVGSAIWSDDAGIHSRMVEPFPAAAAIANLSFGNMFASNLPATFTSISTLLPSLNRARETANHMNSVPAAPEKSPQ